MYILDKLYRGNLSPIEDFPKDNEAYWDAMNRLTKEQYVFAKMISSEAEAQYEKLVELEQAVDRIIAEDCFTKGFRMGVQMMLDVLTD